MFGISKQEPSRKLPAAFGRIRGACVLLFEASMTLVAGVFFLQMLTSLFLNGPQISQLVAATALAWSFGAASVARAVRRYALGETHSEKNETAGRLF